MVVAIAAGMAIRDFIDYLVQRSSRTKGTREDPLNNFMSDNDNAEMLLHVTYREHLYQVGVF